jgi:hypothetical protein
MKSFFFWAAGLTCFIFFFGGNQHGALPTDGAGFWYTWANRLSDYQQLVSGVLTVFAGAAVIWAANIQKQAIDRQIETARTSTERQIETAKHTTERQILEAKREGRRVRGRDAIRVASAILAEIRTNIRALDEFANKFRQNSYQVAAGHPLKKRFLPLPFSKHVYTALLPDIGRLSDGEATKIIGLYCDFDVYTPLFKQEIEFHGDMRDEALLTDFQNGSIAAFRDLCTTAAQDLELRIRHWRRQVLDATGNVVGMQQL